MTSVDTHLGLVIAQRLAREYGQPSWESCTGTARRILADLGLTDADPAAIWRVDISTTLKPNGSIPLSLNDRSSNHFAVNNARAKVKARVRTALTEADVPPLAFVHVEMHYRPKTNQRRDYDNIVATLKPVIDAMHQPDEASHWQPIVAGDDPRYVDWSRPIIHTAERGVAPALWLILRGEPLTADVPGPEQDVLL